MLRLLGIPGEPVCDAHLRRDTCRPCGIAKGTPKSHRLLEQPESPVVLPCSRAIMPRMRSAVAVLRRSPAFARDLEGVLA